MEEAGTNWEADGADRSFEVVKLVLMAETNEEVVKAVCIIVWDNAALPRSLLELKNEELELGTGRLRAAFEAAAEELALVDKVSIDKTLEGGLATILCCAELDSEVVTPEGGGGMLRAVLLSLVLTTEVSESLAALARESAEDSTNRVLELAAVLLVCEELTVLLVSLSGGGVVTRSKL